MSSAKIIQFLVQDLLDYSQINQNKFRQNIKQFDLQRSIEEVMSIQRIQAEDKGVELIADLSLINNTKINHDEHRIQ